jgi:cellulose biosynthesis protein BcsQ
MKAIAFHTEKGGVGKTTIAGNTAYMMAHSDRTLLVDGDPQGNTTSWWITDSIPWEMADILMDRCRLHQAIMQVRENFYILPTFGIDGGLKEYAEMKLTNQPYAFEDLLREIENEDFKYVVFDLGPGISLLERSILSEVQEIVGVAQTEFFSVDGIEIFENELKRLRKERRAKAQTNKLVINRVNRSYLYHNQYYDHLDGLKYRVFTIGQSTEISDAIPNHKALAEYAPKNKFIREFETLAGALMDKQGVLYGV